MTSLRKSIKEINDVLKEINDFLEEVTDFLQEVNDFLKNVLISLRRPASEHADFVKKARIVLRKL